MTRLGIEVHECAGLNGWGGPAVTVPLDLVPEVEAATKVKLDRHVSGDYVVLYPAPNWV